jgi:hypothetical protein
MRPEPFSRIAISVGGAALNLEAWPTHWTAASRLEVSRDHSMAPLVLDSSKEVHIAVA